MHGNLNIKFMNKYSFKEGTIFKGLVPLTNRLVTEINKHHGMRNAKLQN